MIEILAQIVLIPLFYGLIFWFLIKKQWVERGVDWITRTQGIGPLYVVATAICLGLAGLTVLTFNGLLAIVLFSIFAGAGTFFAFVSWISGRFGFWHEKRDPEAERKDDA